jgi:hypothetical protein
MLLDRITKVGEVCSVGADARICRSGLFRASWALPSLSAPKHPKLSALAGVGNEDGQCRRPLPIVGKGGGLRPTPEKGRHRPAQRESERATEGEKGNDAGERRAIAQ